LLNSLLINCSLSARRTTLPSATSPRPEVGRLVGDGVGTEVGAVVGSEVGRLVGDGVRTKVDGKVGTSVGDDV